MTTGWNEGNEAEVDPVVWRPPPEEERQDDQVYDSPIGETDDILRIRLTFDLRDNLVDFAIMVMTGPRGEERQVARADICHTGLHVHWFHQTGEELLREEIRPVTKLVDVQGAYEEVLDRINDRWAEYKRRWRRG